MRGERCDWCRGNDLYEVYHDTEWGVPCREDRKLFEFIVLEGAQAGLSWLTILKRRPGYREAFAGWDPEAVARFTAEDEERLASDPGIIRNRMKIRSAINNARCFLEVAEAHGSFAAYIWDFVDNRPIRNAFRSLAEVPASTALSDRISRDMRQRGFTFFGTTICYAHMQATGMVNDHLVTCPRHRQCGD